MTNPTETTPQIDGDGTEPAPQGNDAVDQNQGLIEARDRYRGERDSARDALAAVQARIEQMQQAEVERLAGESLAMPGDLFSLSGNTVADYLDDNGNVDPERVQADVAEILAERPGLKPQAPAYDPSQGTGGGPARSTVKWGNLFTEKDVDYT